MNELIFSFSSKHHTIAILRSNEVTITNKRKQGLARRELTNIAVYENMKNSSAETRPTKARKIPCWRSASICFEHSCVHTQCAILYISVMATHIHVRARFN